MTVRAWCGLVCWTVVAVLVLTALCPATVAAITIQVYLTHGFGLAGAWRAGQGNVVQAVALLLCAGVYARVPRVRPLLQAVGVVVGWISLRQWIGYRCIVTSLNVLHGNFFAALAWEMFGLMSVACLGVVHFALARVRGAGAE